MFAGEGGGVAGDGPYLDVGRGFADYRGDHCSDSAEIDFDGVVGGFTFDAGEGVGVFAAGRDDELHEPGLGGGYDHGDGGGRG